MRNNKKWLVLLLAFVMLVSNPGISAAAVEDESPITLHAAATGSTVQVQIMATEAQTVADGKLVLTYDAALVTYVDTVAGSAWTNPDKVTLSVGSKTGKVILAFANADAAADGVLFTLTFQASADAVIALDDSSYITGVKANLAQEVSTCLSAQFADVPYLSPEAHDAVDYMVGGAVYTIGTDLYNSIPQMMKYSNKYLNDRSVLLSGFDISLVDGATDFSYDPSADLFYLTDAGHNIYTMDWDGNIEAVDILGGGIDLNGLAIIPTAE